jgi:hypothetical protein
MNMCLCSHIYVYALNCVYIITCRAFCMTYRWVLDWVIGFIETLHTPLRTIGNYSAIAVPTLVQVTVTHTSILSLLRFPLLVSWQWFHKSHCHIRSHMKSSLHSLIPFLPFLLDHLWLPTPELHSILILPTWDCRNIASGCTHRNTSYSLVACWFTAAEMCSRHSCVAVSVTQTHRECCLQHLFYCWMMSRRTRRVRLPRVYGPLPSNSCCFAATVLAFNKYATILTC